MEDGYTFWLDAKLRRLLRYRCNNIHLDLGGRYLYIRDGACVWDLSWKPSTKGARSVQPPAAAQEGKGSESPEEHGEGRGFGDG